MSLRAKASAIVAATAALVLLGSAALALTQPTGKQLEAALIPASGFLPGYLTIFSNNSGGRLEYGTTRRIPPMSCFVFWASIGVDPGYGETAFADEMAGSGSNPVPVAELFEQAVYQFATSRGATSLYNQISAKYRSCRKTSVRDTAGGTLTQLVHARYTERVHGHQALLLVEYLTDSRVPGPPTVTYALWTLDGTDVYLVSSRPFNVPAPAPSLSWITLKLIARVTALR
jgi:hypothetical protein